MNVNVNVIRSPDSLGSELEDLKLIHILPSVRHQARSGLARIEHVEIGGTLSRNNLRNITGPRPGGVSCPVSSLHVLTLLLFHCEVDCKDINNVPAPSHAERRGKIQCRGQNILFICLLWVIWWGDISSSLLWSAAIMDIEIACSVRRRTRIAFNAWSWSV